MNQIFINIKKLIFSVVLATSILIGAVACSKNDDSATAIRTPAHLENWEVKPIVDESKPYMTMLTGVPIGTKIRFEVIASRSDILLRDVWVDLNNNGKWDDESEDVSKERDTYTVKSPIITFYGEVENFICYGTNMQLKELDVTHNKWLRQLGCNWNLLKTLDVSQNEDLRGLKAEFNQLESLKINNPRYLTDIRIAVNNFSEAELLKVSQGLPKIKEGNFYLNQPKLEREHNQVNSEIIRIAQKKRWHVWLNDWEWYADQ